ncbi:MAG: thiamine-phosphate kinase [Pseudoxanthomonas sp.]|nr:thiamine-phosphate kinase [Pseudoxanthomonas sp.]
MAEFDLIERIRARAIARDGVLLGIGDDAALLQVPAGHELVVTADTLNAGVHFPADAPPADIGWKALAVNLSDLASMGARPAWCTLSLSLPGDDTAWLDAFLDGFLGLADTHAVALVGGDTTRGPLSIAVTAMGWVEAGAALRRDGARPGDDVWVTGTLGDAAAALVLGGYVPIPLDGVAMPVVEAGNAAALRARLARPAPRVAVGRALAGLAHACVDVSDGLLADLGHICRRSGVGAEIELARLPASPALRAAYADDELRAALQAAGGDDYELCFSASTAAREAVARALEQAGTTGTRIGRITDGDGVRALAADGSPWRPFRGGYVHFA